MGTRARDGGGRQNRGKTGLTTQENECEKGKLGLRENRDSSLITTGSKGTSHTNPKRERGMPQVSCGATPAPSLTLRVGM